MSQLWGDLNLVNNDDDHVVGQNDRDLQCRP